MVSLEKNVDYIFTGMFEKMLWGNYCLFYYHSLAFLSAFASRMILVELKRFHSDTDWVASTKNVYGFTSNMGTHKWSGQCVCVIKIVFIIAVYFYSFVEFNNLPRGQKTRGRE